MIGLEPIKTPMVRMCQAMAWTNLRFEASLGMNVRNGVNPLGLSVGISKICLYESPSCFSLWKRACKCRIGAELAPKGVCGEQIGTWKARPCGCYMTNEA